MRNMKNFRSRKVLAAKTIVASVFAAYTITLKRLVKIYLAESCLLNLSMFKKPGSENNGAFFVWWIILWPVLTVYKRWLSKSKLHGVTNTCVETNLNWFCLIVVRLYEVNMPGKVFFSRFSILFLFTYILYFKYDI